VQPFLILVEPPQVGFLDPHKYLAVILIVVLVITDENEPIFCWTIPGTHPQPSPQSIFCCCLWVHGCQVCCCCCHPHCQHLKTIESQSTNFHLSQNQCRPCKCRRGGGGGHGEAPNYISCLLFAIDGLIVVVISVGVVALLHAVVDDFIDDREPDATVWPSACILDLLLDYPMLQLTDFPVFFFLVLHRFL
jgi:hypothetical protein